ncbi:MAG: IPT/TIG domain-containing protein [Chloroflexi bacterium]|nr:IPT/TIG domain-containing protein [Chloroflexota bacterium]
MKINTLIRKFLLTVLIAYGGVLWLYVRHKLAHDHGVIGSSPVAYWLRDSVMVLLPVFLAVWVGAWLVQRLADRSNGRTTPKRQFALSVMILGVLTTAVLLVIESSRGLRLGISNDFALEVSICQSINFYGIPLLGSLLRGLSGFDLARAYVLLQDGASLALVSMGITALLLVAINEFEKQLESTVTATQKVAQARIVPAAIFAFSAVTAYGGSLWLKTIHASNSSSLLRDGSMLLVLIIPMVILALRAARLIVDRYSAGTSKLLESTVIISIVGLVSSFTLGFGSTILNVWFGIHSHQSAWNDLSPLAHWGYDGLMSLGINVGLTALVYALFKGDLWTTNPIQPLTWNVLPAKLGRQFTAIGLTVMMIPSLLGLANGNSVSASGANICPANAPLKIFDVSAIDVTIWLDRFGVHDPTGHMYVLNSVIPAVRAQEAAGPSSLSIGLRDDPIQPLAIRANMGDCVVINFTNSASAAVGSTSSAYGMHIDGLAFQMDSSGDAIGNNPSSAVPSGGTITYTYWIPNDPTLEGAHYIHPGPANRQAVAHGLFGTLNVEPPGSIYRNPTTGLPQLSGWEADIIPGNGRPAFRENVQLYHEIGNENETNVPVDIAGNPLPVIDPHTGTYRPGSRAINYRAEPFMDRLEHFPDQKSVVYGSYTFGDTTNVIPRGYLGDPTKVRLVHGGSEVFHVFHLHGGAIRWRFNPLADPTYDYGRTGLDKTPVAVQSQSARLDSQSMGPGEAFNLEIENGAGGGQQGAGEFLFHCHIAHHYFGGMWGYWRVFDTLQPDLLPLPDRTAMPVAVDSSGLVGKTINGQTITTENLDAWIRPQLPPQGVTHDINVVTGDTADQDASVWDWTVDSGTGLYLGEPDSLYTIQTGPLLGQPWPDYANVVPGRPTALIVDQQITAQGINFDAGGYIGDRPKILFNPNTGRPAWPMLRPHIGKRPPFAPNGHSGAPYLGETGSAAPNPVIPFGSTSTQPIDPWANRSDAICPAAAPLQTFNIVGLAAPIQITRAGQTDLGGALFALAEDKDGVYADMDLRKLLAIRGNIGDCLAITYVSELTDGGDEVPYSKANIHIHHVQFDTQASDGVISGFSFEQSVRPYKIVDPQLTAAANPGDTVLQLSNVAKFHTGVWIAIGMGTEGIEIRQITAIDNLASTVTISSPVNNTHPINEWAGTEFVQYRWYPDVELDNVFFHDHVNGIHGWSHGMVGQLVIEPAGSTYHDPVTGAEIRSGAIADIHTSNPLIPGVITGSFREFVLWTINDHTPVEATLNLRAEPWADRSLDPAQRFSSNSPQGDPFTPIFRAYAGDPVVIRNINVGQGTNVLRIEGHRTFMEPRFTDALGISSSPIDAFHSTVSEKYTLVLNGGAGGPNHVPGDYIYHDGENRRFQDGAWGILRVLPSAVGDLQPLPGVGSIPAQQAICPVGAPVHNFNISAVDLPSTAAGGGKHGRRAAFVPTSDVAAVLNKTKFPEPLVLHVAAGECVNVTLNNQRVLARASFHLGGLLRDMNSSGINIGFNPEQTIAPGQSRTYTYYADTHKLESVMISDFGGDNSGFDGMYGAMVVAPAGATFKNFNGFPTDTGSIVNVYVPGEAPYRDFTLILADQDPVIGQNTMPYPADVSGPALINYRQVLGRVDDANMFSSLVNGDPTTPLLRAYAGDPVKVHVLGAPGSEQVHVFNLGGMSWPGDMYINNASQWQSRAIGPWEKMDLQISGGAGGVSQVPGDYFYGDIRRPFTQAGMWGLFRVLPNTCPANGVLGVPCLVQAPPTVTGISPTTGSSVGGAVVTITGTNFNKSATTIKFGAVAATNVSCASATTCTATSPAGLGIADVTATVAGQTSAINNNDKFTFVVPPPSITGIAPGSGSTDGGTVVTISGAHLSSTPGATTIRFGANNATNVSCSSDTTCTATSPAGSVGTVDVIATVGSQSSATSAADQFTYVDLPPVILSSVRLNSSPSPLATVWYSVTFSEPVTGVDMADFNLAISGSVSGAAITSVSGSGSTRSIGVNTGTGNGTIRLDVADDDSILDAASNPLGGAGANNFTSGESYTADKTTPLVASIARASANPTSAGTVNFIVTFSQVVTGVDKFDFNIVTGGAVSGAAISSVSGTGATRTVAVNTGTGSGTLHLDLIDNNTIKDGLLVPLGGAGLVNGDFTSGQTYTIDKTPPTVVSITRSNSNPTKSAAVNFTVTFSESVTGVDKFDFNLATTGTLSGTSITTVSGTGAARTVTVSTGTGSGTLRLDLMDNDTIKDALLVQLGGAGLANGDFNSGDTYTVDKTPPAVVSISRANPDPTKAASVNFTVTFSESVTGVDKFDFNLATTGTLSGTSISTVSGTGAARTVTVNTGTGTGTLRLDLIDNDTIKDALLTQLGGAGLANGNFTSGESYNADKTPPAVVSITRANVDPTNAATVNFIVTFSEVVTGVDKFDFALVTTGSMSGVSITSVGGSGTVRTVTVNTGTGSGALHLDLIDNDTIKDTLLNLLGGTGLANGNFFLGETYAVR